MKRIIPLSQLLTFKNVYREDSNWHAMLAEFKNNPAHWLTVMQLVEELKVNQFFREPVYVGKDEEFDPESFWVFDGTHRACAYLLAEATEVEVEFEHEYETRDWTEPTWLVETEIVGSNGYAMQALDDDRAPALWQGLMSLRLDDKIWLTSDTTTSDLQLLTVYWENSAEQVTDEVINAAARTQLAELGYDLNRLKISTNRRPYDS